MQINGTINALLLHPAAFGVYLEAAPPLETKERDVLLGTLDAFTDLLSDKGVDVSNIHKIRGAMTSMAGANHFRSDLMNIARQLRQVSNRPYFEVATLMMETGEMVFGLYQREEIARTDRVIHPPLGERIKWIWQYLMTDSQNEAPLLGYMADRFEISGSDEIAARYYLREGLGYYKQAKKLFVKGQEAAKIKYFDYAKGVMKEARDLLGKASVAFEKGEMFAYFEKTRALREKIRIRLDWLDMSKCAGNKGEPRWSEEAIVAIARASREEI